MFNYLLAAGIGAMSSILANKNVAVYNDGFRPVYTEYFSGRMDRKSLAATSFAVSFGLIVAFGFTNSIAMGIIIIHTFLLMGDIIGTWCSDTPRGTILSGVIGAVWGIMVVAFMSSIANFFSVFPVNFLPYIGNVADIVVATFAVFPSLAVTYQHGIKKGGITAAITLAAYILVKNFGVFNIGEFKLSLNADGMSMLAGSIVMIVFAVRTKQEAIGADLTNIFSDNVNRIKKNWIYFCCCISVRINNRCNIWTASDEKRVCPGGFGCMCACNWLYTAGLYNGYCNRCIFAGRFLFLCSGRNALCVFWTSHACNLCGGFCQWSSGYYS